MGRRSGRYHWWCDGGVRHGVLSLANQTENRTQHVMKQQSVQRFFCLVLLLVSLFVLAIHTPAFAEHGVATRRAVVNVAELAQQTTLNRDTTSAIPKRK